MESQKHLFDLEQDVHYLNCAAYGPYLKSSVLAAQEGLILKSRPYNISPMVHFERSAKVRALFSQLINCNNPEDIAMISSASYGMAIIAANLRRVKDISKKKKIVSLDNEFPNDYYAFERVSTQLGLEHELIKMPENINTIGKDWNDRVLESITNETALIVLPHVHWIYGVVFDLEKISAKCKEHNCLLVIDGAQSIGAHPFDINKIKPDALICPAYKWLLGPYSIGFMYLGDFFNDGVPLEESWMNRENSLNFAALTQLTPNYLPGNQRYNMGEFSQFTSMPMIEDSLSNLLNWGVENIKKYNQALSKESIFTLEALGCKLAEAEFRASHLYGIILPEKINKDQLALNLKNKKVFVSNRGSALRVSCNVFNTSEDYKALINCIVNA